MKQEAQKVKYSISIFVHIAGILSVLYFAFQLNMDSDARELFATALWAGNSTLDAEAQGIWAVISYLIFNGLPIVLPLLVVGICPLSHLWSTAQVLFFIIPMDHYSDLQRVCGTRGYVPICWLVSLYSHRDRRVSSDILCHECR
ncbi:MAG: hypothetical protein ACLU7D_10580 [Collinsella sp.]